MHTYLACRDIIYIYPQRSKTKKATLRGIDFSLDRGDFISIVGPSGSGKTTFLMIVSGLLEPSAGSVKIGDYIVNELSSKEKQIHYRENIGLMLQDPRENVMWSLTTFENILLPLFLKPQHLKSREIKSLIDDLLKNLSLETKLLNKPSQLSGGELQKLSLAIALANNPDLLILDEPTSQLDTSSALSLIKYLQSLCENENKTIIMVTHDIRMIRRTDKSYVLKHGKLREFKLEGKIENA
ncbi:MAG: ABC transporter ATP-binding protein [Candidatus Thorarchaeota archaeon]